MGAGSDPVVSEGDDVADLSERETGRLSGADEPESIDRRVVVIAVAADRATGWREDAQVLVVADRLGGHAGALRQLADQHFPLTFHCTGTLTVPA